MANMKDAPISIALALVDSFRITCNLSDTNPNGNYMFKYILSMPFVRYTLKPYIIILHHSFIRKARKIAA